jgi:Ca2+-transporting ATPase
MTVQEIWTPAAIVRVSGVGYRPEGGFEVDGVAVPEVPRDLHELLLDAALCSDATLHEEAGAWTITGDPTEGALVVAAEKAGIGVDEARRGHERLDAIPFESEHQYMAVLGARPEGGWRIVMKGAPETVLARCTEPPVDHVAFHAEVDRLAVQGMRVLGVAHRDVPVGTSTLQPTDVGAGFELDGLIGMIDPPLPEAIAAVAACRDAGITVKMITGDHAATAQAIGAQLGLGSEGPAVTGARLAAMDPGELRRIATTTNVFARVAPEHKLGLVRALQADGEVVAMTGDGVNDAPALRQANIGVAMGITGTAVSREAADVVLTDDNFATIAAAVEEGRRVYDNLVKALAFILPTNLGLGLIFVIAVTFFPFDEFTRELLLPMQPAQLLWINMATSVALGLPLAFEAKEPNVMRRPPRAPDAPIFGRVVIVRTVLAASLMAAGAIGLFIWEYFHVLESGLSDPVALADAQTMAVTTVVAFQVFYLLNSRSLDHSLLEIGLFSNWTVWAGIGALAALQLGFIYLPFMNTIFGTVPLPVSDLLLAIAVGVTILPVISVEKWIRARLAARRATATTRPA